MSRRGPRRGRAVGSPDPSLDFLRSRMRVLGIALVCAKLMLIPVIFDHDSDVPFSVIKALLSHALAYMLAGVMLGLVLRYGRAAVVWSWLHVPVLAFLLVNIAATLVAVDPLLALYGAYTRMIGLGTIADCVLLYFAIALLVRTTRDALALGLSFLTGSVVVLAYEFVQILGRDPLSWAIDPSLRPFSTIGQTTNLAEYLTVVAVGSAAIAIFQNRLPPLARMFLMLYSGLAATGMVVTQTRSAIFGVVAGGALLIILTWVGHPNHRARVVSVIGAAAAGGALAGVLVLTPLGARLLSTVEAPIAVEGDSGLRLEDSANVRVALYRLALEMVRDRPALGVGPDNFQAAVPRFRSDSEPFEVQNAQNSSAHGWLAQTAATSGLLGLIAFVGIPVVALVVTFMRGFRPAAWAGLGALGAFLGAGITTVNGIATDWLFWAAAGAIACSTSQPTFAHIGIAASETPTTSRRSRFAPLQHRSTLWTTLALACVGVGLAIAITTVSAVDASRSAKASQFARLRGQSQSAIDLGLRATRLDSLRPQYWRTLGLAYVSVDRFGDAVSAFDHASRLAPYDVRYDGDLARALAILAQRGDPAAARRAREVADRAVQADPNNALANQTRAIMMQIFGDLPEALKSSERAIALDRTSTAGYTTNPDIYVTRAQLLNALGRSQEAVAVARLGVTRLPDDLSSVPIRLELVRSYIAIGQLVEASAELSVVLVLQPDDADAQQLRAQLRARLGN